MEIVIKTNGQKKELEELLVDERELNNLLSNSLICRDFNDFLFDLDLGVLELIFDMISSVYLTLNLFYE